MMFRFLLKLIICLGLAIAAGLLILAFRSGDVIYSAYEWISPARFHQFDNLIRTVATEHQLDPMLVKAVVWRESRFDPRKIGSAGERGLMQVSERAAREWARENQVANFHADESARRENESRSRRLVFAPGFSTLGASKKPMPFSPLRNTTPVPAAPSVGPITTTTAPMSERAFRSNIDFPGTRNYVASVLERCEFYRKRGRM